ncbi:MAG: DUF4347 domain-containing protein, partial [Burkholderiaceae bacterium]|nr:DUF4347 domain-containing protein [Burkholderiaceae bacterium]
MLKSNPQKMNQATAVWTGSEEIPSAQTSAFAPTNPGRADSQAEPIGADQMRAHQIRSAAAALNNGRLEVAFIDAGVADHRALLDGVRAGVEVVLIDAGESGLAQMARWAATHSGYDAIHVLSHGAQGSIRLGDDTISASSLSDAGVKTALSTLGRALAADGDLLLYGCSVAAGEAGQAFIADLAGATGADVAASTDLTGGVAVGGDWDLEKSAGAIETGLFANRAVLDAYDHQLAYTGTIDFENVPGGDTSGLVAVGSYTLVATTTSLHHDVVVQHNMFDIKGTTQLLFGGMTSVPYDFVDTLMHVDPPDKHTLRFSNNETFDISGFYYQNYSVMLAGNTSNYAYFVFEGFNGETSQGVFTTQNMGDRATGMFVNLGLTGITKLVFYKQYVNGGDRTSAIYIDDLQIANLRDATAPVITGVSIPNAAMNVGAVVTATIAVAADADVQTLASGTIGGFALGGLTKVSNTSYTATFTVAEGGSDVAASSDIPVSLVLTDPAGNVSTTYSTPIAQAADHIDANRPVITAVTIPDSLIRVNDVVTATITVASDADALTLASGAIGGFTLAGLTKLSATSYTATFTVAEGGADVAAGAGIPVSLAL